MDESDYKQVCRIIGYVLRQPYLTEEDKDDIRQEAAIAAWKYGLKPSTRVYWAALDAARRIRKKRIFDSVTFDIPYQQHIESTIVAEQLLSCLPDRERISLHGSLQGYTQDEIGVKIGMHGSSVCRYQKLAIERLRRKIK